jgi:polar amino acid transport system substrate-binding protein
MKPVRIAILIIGMIILSSQLSVCFAEEVVIYGNHKKRPKAFLENGKASGILIGIMKYVDQKIPQSFKYSLYPWKRSYMSALKAKGGIIGISKNSERLKIFDYSDVMYYDDLLLITLKGKEFNYKSIQDLKGKTLGVQRGSSYGDAFEKAKGSVFKLSLDGGGVPRLKKLLMGRTDAVILGPGIVGFNAIIKQDLYLMKNKDKFAILPVPYRRDPNFLAFSKKLNNTAFIIEFNRILNEGHKNGDIQKIVDHHSR